MSILIKGGHVIDPLTKVDACMDVLMEGDRIVEVAEHIEKHADQIIDATGSFVMPGFIDLHVHLRDPGLTYKETLETGGKAAVKGGVTTVCAMPNTKPVIDSAEKVSEIHKRARIESLAHIIQIGSVTKSQAGEELADISGMAKAGCYGISEDGKSVMNASLYRKAMRIAKEEDLIVFAHCEDITLVEGGVMGDGENARRLGLKGITNAVEDVIVARDIVLSKETGARLHLCHCSTKDSVTLLAEAKKAGIPVTGEVCPHHFILTANDIAKDDGNYKMNPPLRANEDVQALIEGLRSGVMDVISTDHAPHSEEEKKKSMREAMFGIVGLETVAALTYTALVRTGVLSIMDMAAKMSYNPACILGLEAYGSISVGKKADVVIFNPNATYQIDKESFVSKGKNTPFHGRTVSGEVVCTLVDGVVVYDKQA